MHERSSIARNAATSYASRALLLLSALLLTPYLFRTLGPAGFGTWSVMLTLTAIFSLLELGFSDGIVRFVAAARGEGRPQDARALMAAGTVAMAGWGVIALAVAAIAAVALQGLAADEHRRGFTIGMLALGGAMLVRFPCVAWGAALKGHQRYDLWNASVMVTTAVSALGTVAAIESGVGLLGVAVAHAAALALGGALCGVWLIRVDPGVSLRPALGERSQRRRILGFGSLTLAAESFVYIGQRMDVVIISALRNAAGAAPYAAALKLQSGVQAVTLPFVDLLMPMASELWAQGRRDVLVRRLTAATRVATQLTLPLALGIALFAGDLVDVWLGPAAPPVTDDIVVLLMAVQVFALTATPARKVLLGVGRARLVAGLSMVEGVASVALTVVLVSAYGALGAAVATLATVAAVAPLKLPLACRTLGVPILPFLTRGIGAAVLSTVPAAIAMVAVRAALEPGAGRLGAGLAAGLAAWAAVSVPQVGLRRLAEIVPRRARVAARGTATQEPELGSPALPATIRPPR